MALEDHIADHPIQANPHTAADIIAILRENRWLISDPTPEQTAWSDLAAHLLGHYAEHRAVLANLLRPVFYYDAAQILHSPDAQAAASRHAARDLTPHLPLLLPAP